MRASNGGRNADPALMMRPLLAENAITALVALSLLPFVAAAVGIYLTYTRSAAGNARQSLATKIPFPKSTDVSFERRRDPSSGIPISRFW
jgi:hypothetical protein